MEIQIPIREALLRDEDAFLHLWMDYLTEREKEGSLIAATSANVRHYQLLFRSILPNPTLGVVVLAEAEAHIVGAGLYGPRMPLDASGGRRICIGNGTYVDREWRRRGLSATIYNFGFAALRARGFTHITGAVDAMNEVSLASVLARGMDVTSIQFLKEL